MQIHLRPPCPALRPYVECFWSLRGKSADSATLPRIPPFGEVELAIYQNEPFQYQLPGAPLARAPRAHLTGPRTRYLDLFPGEVTDLISVRFRPGAFHSFYPGAVASLAGEIVSLEELWGPAARRLADDLEQTPDIELKFQRVELFLLERLQNPLADCFIPDVIQALNSNLNIVDEAEIPPVDALARSLGLSRRTFQRRFQSTFGLAPLKYRNLLRFESAVKDSLRRTGSGELNLTDQALKFGYYDQSHFIRDFQKYIGRAPGDFLRDEGRFIRQII